MARTTLVTDAHAFAEIMRGADGLSVVGGWVVGGWVVGGWVVVVVVGVTFGVWVVVVAVPVKVINVGSDAENVMVYTLPVASIQKPAL